MIDEAVAKSVGIKVEELSKNLTKKLENPYFHFMVDTSISFKEAKKLFKKMYVERMLGFYFGDVSAVARAAGIDRRSIHRIIKETRIDVAAYRKMMLRPEYVREIKISSLIEGAVKEYEDVLNPKKLSLIYSIVPKLSEDILKELPVQEYSLKEAEEDFERNYLTQALKENNWGQAAAARKIGLRYETLHRKVRELSIKKEQGE